MAIDIHINNFRNLITSAPKTDYYAFNNNNNPPDLNIITAANFDDFINTSIGSAFLRYIKENRFKDPVCDKTVWEKLASSERKFSNLNEKEQQEVLYEFNKFHIQSFMGPDEYAHTCHEGGIKYIKLLIESPIGYNFLQILKAEGEKDEILKSLHAQFVAADRDITLMGKGAQFLFVYLLREYLKSACQKVLMPENPPDNIKAIIKQFKENKNFGSVKTLLEGQFKLITEDNFKTLINDKEFKIIFRRFQFHYGFLLWNLFCKAGKSLICKGPVVPVLPDKDIPPDYIAEYNAKIRPVQVAENALAENNGNIKAVPPFDRKIFLDELNKFIFEHFLFDTFITSGNIEEVYNSVYAQDFKDKFLKPQYPLLFNLVETTGIKQVFSLYPNTANALERLFNRWFLSDRKNIELSSSQLSNPQPQYILDVLAWARGGDIADKKVLPQMIDAKYTENRKFAIITLENFDEYINDAEIGDKFIYVFLKGEYLEFEKEMEKLRQNSDISYAEAFKLRQIMPKLQRLSEIYKKLLKCKINERKLDEDEKTFILDDFNKFHFVNFKYKKYFDFSDVSHDAIEIGSFVFPSNPFVAPFSHNRYAQIMSVLLSPYGRDFLDNKLAKEKPYSYIYENFRACNYLIPKMEEKHKEELDILMACLIMYIQTGGESIKLNPDIENALARKYDHDCAIPDNTEGLINLVNVLEKIAFSHKETSIKPVEKVKKPKHSAKKFNIITAANFKEYLESDIGENFKAVDGILNIITGCGADISKLPEEQQAWLLAKFNDFYLENYKYETYVEGGGAAEILKTVYGAHFKGLLEEECPLLYQSLEKNGMTGANSFFITARLNTYFKSGRKTTVTASINISAEEQDKIIKENSGKISAILENGIKPKKEGVSPVHILLNFLILAVDEYSKEKTKLIDFPLNEISEIITLTLEVLNLEKFTFEAFDAKYRALAFKDDLILIAVTDTGAVAINKVTGKKVFLSDEQIIARGMNKEHKGWQDTTALNALVEHWDKMLTAIAKLYSNEARIYYKVKPRLEEKYGKDSSVLKAVFKLLEDAVCAVAGEQKYPQVNTREKEGPEYEFKESIFKIICYNVMHEGAELNKFGMLLSNSLYLKFDFLEGKKPTWFNVAQGLRKAEKLNFRTIKTQKEIQIDCKDIGGILKPVGDRLIDIDAVLQTSSSSNTGTSAAGTSATGTSVPGTSAEREIIQIILGAAKGMLVDFPLMAAHMTINPLAAKLFFWNFEHPESMEAALTEFFNIMEKGNRFDTAAYFSFNLTLLALMFKGGMEAFHGKTFAVEGRKTISGIEVLINGKLCNEVASKTLLEVLKIRPEDIENKKIELSLKKRDDGIIELSNGAKLTEDGAKCLSGALKSGFTLGIKRAPSEKPGEPGELRFTLNGILLGEKESKEIIKAIIEARLKPESVEVESGGKRMRITGGVDDLKIENLSSTPSSTRDNLDFPSSGGHKHHREPGVHPAAGGPMPGNKRFNYPGQQPQQPEPQINSQSGAGNGNTPNKPKPREKTNGAAKNGAAREGAAEFTGAAKRLNDLNAKINALIAQKSRYADFKLIEILEEYNEICRELKNLDEKTNDLLSEVYKNISEAPSKLGFTKESRVLFSFLNQALEKCNEAYRKLTDSDILAKDLLTDVYRNILETSSSLDFPEGIKFLSSFLKKAPEEVLMRRIAAFTSAVLELPKVKNSSKGCSAKIFNLEDYLSLYDETRKKINELSDKTEDRTASVFLRAALNNFTEKFYNAVMDIISELDIETRSEFLLTFIKTIPDEMLNNHLAALSYLTSDLVSKRMEALEVFRNTGKPLESTELFLYIKECNERFEELKKFSALSEKKQGLIDLSRLAREKRELITIHYSDILNTLETRFKGNVEVKRSALNALPDEVLREECVSKRIPSILTDKLTKEQEKELGILRHNLKAPFEALPATFDVFSRLLRKNKVDNPALYEKMSILHDKASALFTKVTKYFSKDSDSFTSANFKKELLEKTNDLRREVEEIGAVIKDTDFSGVPDSMKFLVESIIDSPEKIRTEIDKIESSLKLDKAYIQSNSNEFNLRSFTENIKADFVNRQAKGRPATILVQIPENLFAYANEQALTEMFRNVLDNDIKIFDMDSTKKINENRGCVITITAKEDAASGMTEITISDNGPGVHRDRKNSILIGDSTTGGGFGLQRCVELALSHGGEFYEDGVFGIGALFVIKLPRRPKEAGKHAPQNQAQPQNGTDFPATSGGHNHHRDWPTHPEAGGESPVNRRRGINGSNSGGGSNWRRKTNEFFPAEPPRDKNLSPAEVRETNKQRSAQNAEAKIHSDFESLTPFIDETLASCGFSRLETHIVSCRNILAEINDCLDSKHLPDESKTRLLDKKEKLLNTYFPNIFEKARDLLKNKKIDARNIRTLYSQLPEKIKQTASMRSIIQEIGEELFFRGEVHNWETLKIFVRTLDLDIDPHRFLSNLLARADELAQKYKLKNADEFKVKIEQLIKESKQEIKEGIVSNSKPAPKTVIMNAVPSHPRRSAPKPKKQGAPKPKEKSPKLAPKATALSEYINNRKIKLSGPEISILKFLANNKYSEAGKALNHYSVNITEFKNNFFNLIKDEDIPSDKRLEIIGDLGFTGIEEARSKVMKFYDIQKAPKREKGGSHQKAPKTSGPLGALSSARNDLGFITNYL